MRDLRDLPYLSCKTVKGREYWYFRRGDVYARLPDISDASFLTAYNDAKRGRAPVPADKAFTALIASYKRSDRFDRLGQRTKSDYNKVMAFLITAIGTKDPRRYKRRHVIEMRDSQMHRMRFANYAVAVMSILMEHAIDLGWRKDNPAKGVHKLKDRNKPDAHTPWSDEARAAFEANAGPRARLIYELCIGTGQRIGDVLAMKWDDVSGGDIRVVQNKTKAALWIPMTGRLAAYLATVPRDGVYIAAKNLREPLSYPNARHAMAAARKGTVAAGMTIHALRYTAAIELAEAGCTEEEISSITGHKSLQMIEKYTRGSLQRQRAKSAQDKRK
jgi:integrase